MKEKTKEMLDRLGLVKDLDAYHRKLLNDCYDHIDRLQDEVDRLEYHNNNLMNVIYQNQSELESL